MACSRNILLSLAVVLILCFLDSLAAGPRARVLASDGEGDPAATIAPPADEDQDDEDESDEEGQDEDEDDDEDGEGDEEVVDDEVEEDPDTSTAPSEDSDAEELESDDIVDSSTDEDEPEVDDGQEGEGETKTDSEPEVAAEPSPAAPATLTEGSTNQQDGSKDDKTRIRTPPSDLREFGSSFRRPSRGAVEPVADTELSDERAGDDAEVEGEFENEETLIGEEDDQPEAEPDTQGAEPQTREPREPVVSIFESAARSERSQPILLTVDGSAILDVDGKLDMAQIANPEVADLLVPAPGRVIVVGKNAGATQLLLKIGSKYEVYHVSVTPDFSDLENLIRLVSPASSVHIGTLRGRIVLSGYVPDGETAQRIEQLAVVHQGGAVVNHLSVAGVQQTLLRVTVAEVNKTALRSLGVNWAVGGANLSRDFFLANNLGQLNPTNIGSNGLTDLTTGQLTYSLAPVGTGPNTNITFGFPRAELQFFLSALRENGLSRTLAEPNLVAISGQTASFLAGGEVPIPVSQGGATAGAITIQYKEFGVRLAFTPTVVGGQAIRLHVMTEVSEPVPQTGPGAGGLPLFAFNTRRVESTIECGSDQSFAIAGLLNEKINSIASKIPGVGDLPILGTLFSSVNYQKEQTELVVIVSPQMVEPLEPNQVPPPPGSLLTEPNDFELFTLQKLQGQPAAGAAATTDAEMTTRGNDDVRVEKGSNPTLVGQWGIEEADRPSVER